MDVIFLAFALTAATVVIHGLGTSLSLAHAVRIWHGRIAHRRWLRMELLMAWLVSTLLVTHFVEVSLWAAVYGWWETLPDFSTAVYYSLTSYTTVGYGDVILPDASRLLGPIEALVGVLMMGWSTAIIVTIVHRFYRGLLPPDEAGHVLDT